MKRQSRYRAWVLVLAGATPVLQAACNLSRTAPEEGQHARNRPAATPAPSEEGKASGFAAQAVASRNVAYAPQPAVPAPNPLAARKLIRTGQLTIEVGDYGEAAEKVAAVARSRGGYVAGTQSARGEHDRRQGTLTVRIPSDRFEEAFAALKPLGKLMGEEVSVEDVTRAYTDLETRLRVKRDTEARLRDILRTRTAKLSDVLEAERELARVTEEIERMEGERRFYDQQVAMSTISVTLREPEPILQSGALQPIREALRDSLRVLATSVAALVYAVFALLPWLVVLGAAAVAVRALHRRRVTTDGKRDDPA
jgi:hypothetical protein